MRRHTATTMMYSLVVVIWAATVLSVRAPVDRIERTTIEPASGQLSPSRDVKIRGASPQQEATIQADLELYAQAGLTLPRLRISVHDSRDGCGGWVGMYDADGSGNRIDLCGEILRHELAHAWIDHHVDDATRQEFVEHANVTNWDDRTAPHGARGVEHAAHAIAWGVDTERLDGDKIERYRDLLNRYELLVGRTSPRVAVAAAPSEPGAVDIGGHSVYGANAAMVGDVATAIQLYDRADLEMPPLHIYVHSSRDGCNGHPGLYSKDGDKQRIDVCLQHRNVVMHELAHAWEHHNVVDSLRLRLMSRLGLESWNDHTDPHHRRGIERAAEIVAWGTAEEPIQWYLRTYHAAELDLYELVTGRESPRIAHWADRLQVTVDVALEDPIQPAPILEHG